MAERHGSHNFIYSRHDSYTHIKYRIETYKKWMQIEM